MIPSYICGAIRNLEELSDTVITVESIGAALAKINRFNGQTAYPYSVAQHSVLVSHLVKPSQALEALFHDAAEAYIGDLSKWIKPRCPEFQALEDDIAGRIYQALHLRPEHEEIKRADTIALRLEQMYIQKRIAFHDWERIEVPVISHAYQHLTEEMSWKEAFLSFLIRHAELVRWR